MMVAIDSYSMVFAVAFIRNAIQSLKDMRVVYRVLPMPVAIIVIIAVTAVITQMVLVISNVFLTWLFSDYIAEWISFLVSLSVMDTVNACPRTQPARIVPFNPLQRPRLMTEYTNIVESMYIDYNQAIMLNNQIENETSDIAKRNQLISDINELCLRIQRKETKCQLLDNLFQSFA